MKLEMMDFPWKMLSYILNAEQCSTITKNFSSFQQYLMKYLFHLNFHGITIIVT